MAVTSYHYQRRRLQRPPGSGFEFWAWFFMRVSGVLLLGLAVFHVMYMHMVIGIDNINFDVLAFIEWTHQSRSLLRKSKN